jgi:hypothetical protein
MAIGRSLVSLKGSISSDRERQGIDKDFDR